MPRLEKLQSAKRQAQQALAAMGLSKRRQDLKKLKHERRLNRQRDLYKARDARRDARRQWLVKKRRAALGQLAAAARVMAPRPATLRRLAAAAWAKAPRPRQVKAAALATWRLLLRGWRDSASARGKVRDKTRDVAGQMRFALGVPIPPAQVATDLHDDDIDSDGSLVRHSVRTRRPASAGVLEPVVTAPPVPPAVAPPRPWMGMTEGSTMMHPAHQAVVDVFREAVGGWQPPDEGAHDDYEAFFSSWQEMFSEMADVARGLADRFRDETPVETATDYLEDLANGLAAMGDSGAEVYEAWRTGNAADHERAENPRPNEQQLNVA